MSNVHVCEWLVLLYIKGQSKNPSVESLQNQIHECVSERCVCPAADRRPTESLFSPLSGGVKLLEKS